MAKLYREKQEKIFVKRVNKIWLDELQVFKNITDTVLVLFFAYGNETK